MKFLLETAKRGRTLAVQLAFVVLALAILALLSYRFMVSTVQESIVRHTDSVMDSAEEWIAATTLEFETTLDVFAEEIRAMLLRGDAAGELWDYVESTAQFTFLDGKSKAGIEDFYGYFEALPGGPAFIHSSAFNLPAIYRPRQENWYRAAMAAGGERAQTAPFIDAEGQIKYTYSKCIFDENGQSLGVVCLRVGIDMLGQRILRTAKEQGGYGILINQNGLVLYHPNEAFVGRYIRDYRIPLSELAEEIHSGVEIFERPMISYNGEPSVSFFRTQANGWHLGLVMPEVQYYGNTSRMGWIMALISVGIGLILMLLLIRLDMARKKSDDESKRKSTFLANMSHEIRTPINAIVGMSAIGKAADVSERKDYCFDKIDDASRHLLGVVNDILDMSKIEADKIELSPTDFVFEKMLQQVANVVNFRIDEKHQTLAVYLDKAIPRVLFADEQRLAQIITNLLGNAVKFTPDKGTIRLNASLLGEEGGVCTIQVDIIDDGIGIGVEQQAKLFQVFQQAESSTTRKYGGTGLGLVISKNFVELMGGRIWVESQPGAGAKFSFTLKAKRGDDIKQALAQYNIHWGNVRILTVDDDTDILHYFHEIVRGFGATCDVAPDAGQALQQVKENGRYNIYFLDLNMPGTDGIALTRQLRAMEESAGNAIVVMISSAEMKHVEEEAKQAGVDRFLLKPIFPSTIADVVNECIGIANQRENEAPMEIDGVFAGARVLLAEDIDINREIVLAMLEPTGIEIDCAENGAQAVQMFIRQPQRYDLIFMDIQMPEMDGYEAARQIRALEAPGANDIPIVAMTANVFKEDVEKCLAAGMNGHIGKPIDFDNIFVKLQQYLF